MSKLAAGAGEGRVEAIIGPWHRLNASPELSVQL